MMRNICLRFVKVAAAVILVGTATSACWVHDGDGRYGHHGDYREGRHDDRR
jgi:hypothetical protein